MILPFLNNMDRRSTVELVKMITIEKEDYEDSAVEAANKVLKKRNVSAEEIDRIRLQLEAQAEKEYTLRLRQLGLLQRSSHLFVDTFVVLVIGTILINLCLILSAPMAESTFRVCVVASFVFAFGGYYIVLESKYQKTLGKLITDSSVVTTDGEKPSTNTIIQRTLCRLIPLDRLSYLLMEEGFHDRFSNTRVLLDRTPKSRK